MDSKIVEVIRDGAGAGGAGWGAGGLIGGVLIGALLGNNGGGLFGGGSNNSVTAAVDTSEIIGEITSQTNQQTILNAISNLGSNFQSAFLEQNANRGLDLIINNISATKEAVSANGFMAAAGFASVNTNIDKQTMLLNTAISAEAAATRALITSNLIDSQRAEILDLKDALRDERYRSYCDHQNFAMKNTISTIAFGGAATNTGSATNNNVNS